MSLGWEPDDVIAVINRFNEEYGEEALEIVEKALAASAYEWGKERSKEDYPEINPKNFIKHFKDNPDEEMEFLVELDKSATIITKKCRVAEVFTELNSMDIGFRFKCSQDYKIAEGYDKEMKLEIVKCLMKGDDCCIHKYTKG